jgi:cobalt-zinc-cadmium efflux system membrane fusion protein
MPGLSKSAIAALAAGAAIAAAGAGYFVFSRAHENSAAVEPTPPVETPTDPDAPPSVMLTPELIEGTNIKIGQAGTAVLPREIPVNGLIEANSTQQMTVVAKVGGRVTRADVEVGDVVRRGQVLAELSSPDLVEAERTYLTAKSELQTHNVSLGRLEKLLEIGAIPRQDVEKARTQQNVLTGNVEAAQARLELFGLTAEQVSQLTSAALLATTTVVAPSDGVLMVRNVSPDAVVQSGASLFTVANLAVVWAVGDLSVVDIGRVHLGNPVVATIPTPVVIPGLTPSSTAPPSTGAAEVPAAPKPGTAYRGTVSYIDPQVNAQTKATRVRADVTNVEMGLRPGMPIDIVITADESGPAVVVPRVAIERIDDRRVVYVADPRTPNRFVERTIEVGHEIGDLIQVVNGVSAGDTLVVDGVGLVIAQALR